MACLRGNRNRKNTAAALLGIALMTIGIILLLAAMPKWVWCAAAAVFLIGLGYIIWRFLG